MTGTTPAGSGSNRAHLDAAVARLQAASGRWAALPVPARIHHLTALRHCVDAVAQEWVAVAVRAKGIRPGSALEGEEWLSGPYAVLTWIAAMTETLQALHGGADPLAGYPISTRPDGQAVVSVYPHGLVERLLLPGYSVEVRLEPGGASASRRTAAAYRRPPGPGAVALVLGAGNISSIAPLDVLYKLYAANEVVLCKLNPINDYLRHVLDRAFRPLITDGYVAFVAGGADVGEYLCHHPGVGSVHITGSARTHDAIVFGTGAAGEARKGDDAPVLTKPITSELGGVGPTIVVPGPWTGSDIAYQAEHVATQKLHNSGHNCIAAQVLVLPASWSGSRDLLAAIRRVLRTADPRPAYYPGAEQRRREVMARYPQAETLGGSLLIDGLDSADDAAYAFTEEFFGPILAATALPATSAAAFLAEAVDFCNTALHGTLGANVLIHPRTAAALGPALDAAVRDLRYGTVGINAWTGVGYLMPRACWGAFGGGRLADIGSGIGVVHNALLLDEPQKTVVRGPFAALPRSLRSRPLGLAPKPPWFVTNRAAARTSRRLTRFAADRRLRRLPGIFAAALRG